MVLEEITMIANNPCSECRQSISAKRLRYHAVTCSARCHKTRTYRLSRRPGSPKVKDSSHRGAISELSVCADLMEHGYDVFRAISPSATCDLVAMKNGRCLKIEVKTTAPRLDGSLIVPNCDNLRYDVLATVLGNRIEYFPSIV